MRNVVGVWCAMSRCVNIMTMCCVVALTSATVQAQFLGGDFRNTTLNIGEGMGGDLALSVQTDDQGKPQVTGGVTVKQGDKVSFDERGVLKTQTAGFWKGETGKKYKVLFRDTKGIKFAIVELQGEVRWGNDRSLSKGNENLLQIATVATPDTWEKITKTEIEDGKLRLVTESGASFFIYDLSCDFSGTIEKEAYEKVDPTESHIVFEGAFKSIEVDSAGNVVQINGVVKRLTVANEPIERETDKITLENKNAFILTKNYGKFKVTFNSNMEATFWLTPSQKKKLLAMTKKEQLPTLTEGSTAYIRVKEYAAKPLEDAMTKGNERNLNFGQTVKLIQKKDGPPTMWLVSTEKDQAWIPAYLLTGNKAEIDFLKKNDRIPSTMTFVYKKDDVIKVWGLVRFGFLVVDSQGLAASADGSSQVAFKGNAVLFDESAVKHAWKNPMVFSKGNTTYEVKSACLYYCVAVDDSGKGTFDCVNLISLSFCKR